MGVWGEKLRKHGSIRLALCYCQCQTEASPDSGGMFRSVPLNYSTSPIDMQANLTDTPSAVSITVQCINVYIFTYLHSSDR
jgi:hypothetical protein